MLWEEVAAVEAEGAAEVHVGLEMQDCSGEEGCRRGRSSWADSPQLSSGESSVYAPIDGRWCTKS